MNASERMHYFLLEGGDRDEALACWAEMTEIARRVPQLERRVTRLERALHEINDTSDWEEIDRIVRRVLS